MADNYIGEGFGDSLNHSEERIRQLEEEIRRLKAEDARHGRKQRKKEISQKRRDAVNARWSKEAPTSEVPTSEAPTSEAPTSEAPTSEAPIRTESYTAANAVALRSQNIVRQPYWNTEHKAVQLPYKPTEEQVRAYMVDVLRLREDVAEEEARKFLRYNDARGWKFSGTTSSNWEGSVQLWTNRTEERRGKAIYAPLLTEEQRQEEERKSIEKEIDVEARVCVRRIRHGDFADEEGAKASKVQGMIIAGVFSEDRLGHVAKRAGVLLIDLWAQTYAERIIMEDFSGKVGETAKSIKKFLDSGKFSTQWFWHGMEMRVKSYLEQWEKGPGRPVRRLAPITSNVGKDVPQKWKYLKTLVDRSDFSGGCTGARARMIAEKVEKCDFSGGEDGAIAEWIVTGKVPPRPTQTTANAAQSQPLKETINKSVRNIMRKT